MFINTETLEYPISAAGIRSRFPLVSFTDPFEAPAGYAEVQLVSPPSFDSMTQTVEEGTPALVGGKFVQTWVLKSLTASQIESRSVAVRTALKNSVTEKRWRVETGGINLPNGAHILTASSDQARITSTIAGMDGAGITVVDFKANNGWVTLTIDELKGIRSYIAHHVQACFSAERAHHEAIDALDASELSTYDISQGWPG